MARGQLSNEDRLRIQVTKLRNGIKSRDERILALELENKELRTKLEDLGFQFERMKAIVFGKKSIIKKIIDDDNDKKPPTSRSRESYQRPIPKYSEVTNAIVHKLPPSFLQQTRIKIFYVEDIPLDTKKTVTKHIVHQYYDGGILGWRDATAFLQGDLWR